MKKIIVATDFSDASQNAVNYAFEMATYTKADLMLLHVYHIPTVSTDVAVMIPSLDDIEKNCKESLENIKSKLQIATDKSVNIDTKCICGFAVEEISLAVDEERAELLIMGMHGAGYLSEKLIGSVTTSLIKKSKCPVLVISKKNKFKKPDRIVLAFDYASIDNKKILNPLKSIIQLFNSKLLLLNVVKKSAPIPSLSEAAQGVMLDHTFEEFEHDFHSIHNNDVIAGINQFVIENNIDLLVMIPRNHSAFWNLFNEANTKKMAFHSSVPLLTLHE